MRTVRAEIMLDLDKLKEDLPLFQVWLNNKFSKTQNDNIHKSKAQEIS